MAAAMNDVQQIQQFITSQLPMLDGAGRDALLTSQAQTLINRIQSVALDATSATQLSGLVAHGPWTQPLAQAIATAINANLSAVSMLANRPTQSCPNFDVYLTGSDRATPPGNITVVLHTYVARASTMNLIHPSESTIRVIVACIIQLHVPEIATDTGSMYNVVQSFKAQLRSRSKHAAVWPHQPITNYPADPAQLPPAVYATMYPDEAHAGVAIPNLTARGAAVPLRKSHRDIDRSRRLSLQGLQVPNLSI